MEIERKKIKIKDLVDGYTDRGIDGVFSMNGQLNIRPSFQREFVYTGKERERVIDSVLKGRPLNIIYFSQNEDGSYEVLDGQQRITSICQFAKNMFSAKIEGKNKSMAILKSHKEDDKFFEYEIEVNVCTGTKDELIEWFEIINISNKPLSKQEVRNAIYNGPLISGLKSDYSDRGTKYCQNFKKYSNKQIIRQDFLEEVLGWYIDYAEKEYSSIDDYLAVHIYSVDERVKINKYTDDVFNWIQKVFPKYYKEMRGLKWGILYNQYNHIENDKSDEVARLMADEDVTNKKGIFEYILSGNEKYLNIRAFDDRIKRKVYEDQNGICLSCNEHFEIDEMEADHIIPWSKGGKTEIENCQMLCKKCNRTKSDK